MIQRERAKKNLTRQMDKKQGILIETDQASVMKDKYPKAQYHFLVVAKAEIPKVTALKREHLPLLDHMMELANQIIEQQNHLPSSSFLVGFKIDAFMDSLTMHVISKDFYSVSMRKLTHWNGFNTDLFLTYQAVYALLQIQGSIEPLSEEKAQKLRETKPIHCNQCDFECDNLASLKFHLYEHWKKREDDFEIKKQVDKITKLLDESKVNDDEKPALNKPEVDAPSQTKIMPKNWCQNQDQNPADAKEPPKENWRLNMNQTPNEQNQNEFAKHFKKTAIRQNVNQQQQQQNVNPVQQLGLMGPRPDVPFRPFIPQPVPNGTVFHLAFAIRQNSNQQQQQQNVNPVQQLGLMGPRPDVPFRPFIPQPVPNGTVPLHQFPPQPVVPHFNPFRQPPNMTQLPPQMGYNGQNSYTPNLNNSPNGKFRKNPVQMKPPTNESEENKPKWKPRPQHNQGQNNGNAAKDNALQMKTQANESVENKPKWQPRPQHNQGQNKGVSKSTNGATQNKPNWKPKGPKQQNPGQQQNTSNANNTSSTN